MSDSVPAGVDSPEVGSDGSQPRGRGGRGLAKADAEAIGAALDADPVVLRGAVARSLEVLTDAGRAPRGPTWWHEPPAGATGTANGRRHSRTPTPPATWRPCGAWPPN